MNVVIVGSGNVAEVLGQKFKDAGHKILQIVGRNAATCEALAREWNTDFTTNIRRINTSADFYLIAVADDAIESVAQQLKLPGKVVAHTAAVVPANILQQTTEHYGVFYPLQSLRRGIKTDTIPIYTEAATEQSNIILNELAAAAGGSLIYGGDRKKRTKLHLAAVLVNNFTNYIFSVAEDFCKKEHIDFKELIPLIRHTVNRMEDQPPARLQTGPAARGDLETIARHEAMLEKYPEILTLYRFFTERILKGLQ